VAVIIMFHKRNNHVADANVYIKSATSSKSKSKIQRPSTEEEVNSALMRSARSNDEVAMRMLLANWARVDVADEGGWPVLMIAAISGNEEVVRMLLEKGAAVYATNKSLWWLPASTRGRSTKMRGRCYLRTGRR
jgi:ankyrin repeat protein